MTCYSDTDMFGLSKSAVTNSLTFENQVSFFFFYQERRGFYVQSSFIVSYNNN